MLAADIPAIFHMLLDGWCCYLQFWTIHTNITFRTTDNSHP